MKIIVINMSSDACSYAGGLVVVPAESSLDVPQGLWIRMYSDLQFLTDLRNSNLILSDGVTSYRYPDTESFVRDAINRIKFDPVRKDFSYSSAQTNTVIWTPTNGKKFVVTDLIMNVRNSTLGAINLTIFDDTNATGNILHKATYESGANIDVVSNLITAFISSNINRTLKITTSGGLMVSGTIWGYETE